MVTLDRIGVKRLRISVFGIEIRVHNLILYHIKLHNFILE